MQTFTRLVQGTLLAGFLISSSGCIIAPDRDRDGGDRDRAAREHEHDRNDRDHRCDEHDEHCRDR